MALGTQPARKEQAKVRSRDTIRARIAAVPCNIASRRRSVFGEVFVLAIATGPLVIPDVEHGAGLWGRFGFYRGRIDLNSCGPAFAPDYLLRFLLLAGFCDGGRGVVGCGEGGFGWC